MKINVNGYNEILSYEGTPEELAEFVATGILFPYMDYSEEEECDCEEEIVDSYKDKIREDLAAEGYICSDEEFDDAYRVAVEIMGPLKELFE